MKCACSPALDHHVTLSKLVHNWMNLGSQRAKFGSDGAISEIERRCPFCQQAEDFTHVLTCKAPRALKFRYEAMTPLRRLLSGSGAGGKALLKAVKVWTADPRSPVVIEPDDETYGINGPVEVAMASQTQIGWINLFRGFVSQDWGRVHPTPDIFTPKDRRTQSAQLHQRWLRAGRRSDYAKWQQRSLELLE